MTGKPTRDELLEQLAAAQRQRGGVKSFSIQSPTQREHVEFMSDAEIEAAINSLKREIRELDGNTSRITNLSGKRGYSS